MLLVGVAMFVAACGSITPPNGSHPPTPGHRGGIPQALLSAVRPIGRGPRFQPGIRGPVPGACTAPLGRRLRAHVEIFGADRVVLLAAGIGTRPPRRLSDRHLTYARCFGDLVTLDPTGTVYLRPGRWLTLGALFAAWGHALTARRVASFTGGRVRVYVNGRRRRGSPGAVVIAAGAEIVLEVGPQVPPHVRFGFATAPARNLR